MLLIGTLPEAHTEFVVAVEPYSLIAGLTLVVLTCLVLVPFYWMRCR